MIPKIFGTKKILPNIFLICHESVMNLFWMGIFWICFESVRNVFWTWMLVTHSWDLKHILGPKIKNHSLGIREIWFQKYWGQKKILSKIFWICHESVMNLFSMWIFWICFESVRNVFWTWMLVTHSLGLKHIFGSKKSLVQQNYPKKF